MIELLLIAITLLLVLACGIFVASEFAFITVNRGTVERLAAKGDRRAQGVAKALSTLSTQLSGAQVGITITNLAIGFLAGPVVSSLIEPPLEFVHVPGALVTPLGVVIGTGLATLVTMVFGELVPKNIAIAKPLATAKRIQGVQRRFSAIMKVPIVVLNNSANFLLRRMGVTPQEELTSARSADELTSLVRRSAEKGTLPKETALMLERSLEFDELSAHDVMTPRIRIKAMKTTDTAASLLAMAQSTGFSRFPVITSSSDNVSGVVHIKQALAVPKHERGTVPLERIMTQPLAVPASLQLDSLLKTLRKNNSQMAIVIDEFGGTDGIVTIEDLIEELVGEVHDEHDRSRAVIRKIAGGGWMVSGLLRPDEVGEELGIFLPEDEEFETIAGLITDRMEHIPVVGESIDISAVDRDGRNLRVHMKVERMEGRRIDKVQLRASAEDKTAPARGTL